MRPTTPARVRKLLRAAKRGDGQALKIANNILRQYGIRAVRPGKELRRYWTAAEDRQLRKLYPNTPTREVALQLGRSVNQINNRAQRLQLRKSAAYLANPDSGRFLRGVRRSPGTEFKPGRAPANKGLRRPGYAPGRMKQTQFRKGERHGRADQVWQPVGSERVSKDGYLERKIHEGLPLQSRWRAVHLIRWEAENGPLPPGHALVFRDGDKGNTDPANMELVTRAELMRRNSYHNRYPKDVARLIQLRGALNRKINNRVRKGASP